MEGESGPKARSKGVVDGKQVNIPVLVYVWYQGTEKVETNRCWISMEIFKVRRGRIKTILELRNDTYKFFKFILVNYHASKKSLNYYKT
jgi:hypothetical protein